MPGFMPPPNIPPTHMSPYHGQPGQGGCGQDVTSIQCVACRNDGTVSLSWPAKDATHAWTKNGLPASNAK